MKTLIKTIKCTGKTAGRRAGKCDSPRLQDWEEVCGCGCEWRDSGRKQLLEQRAEKDFQPLLFPLKRSALHHVTGLGALRRSETDLRDSKTKAARLPGTTVTQPGKQGAGAGERLGEGGGYLTVPVISLHPRQLQLQAGHLGHQLQLLGLQSRAGQQLLTTQSLPSSA